MNALKSIWILVIICPFLFANSDIEIVKINGDVKVRLGVKESWIPAAVGMQLKEIDTILSLEGEVVLKIGESVFFHLGNNAILDIGDLRRISKRQLFLFLMSQKIERVEAKKKSGPLKIGNVSVIHGEAKGKKRQTDNSLTPCRMEQELNGARALYLHQLYTNTIVSLHKTLSRYPEAEETGEIYYYLGKSFELLEESGQAIDCYQHAVNIALENENPPKCYWLDESDNAINRLKSKQ